MAGFQQD